MFIIGELINGMYTNIALALKDHDKKIVQTCALEQIASGADALDVCCGPASQNPLIDMPWLVEVIQEVTDKPLCLDSSKPKVIAEGLKAAKNKTIINSTTADAEKLEILIPLAKKYKSKLIGITISAAGIPQNKDQRLELAAIILTHATDGEFPITDLYLDPIVMPVNVAQGQIKDILLTIAELKIISEPSPKTIIGLSNISQGAKVRSLINRTFLTMAVASGLDSAILDPKDKELMDTLITAELILNKNIYCDSYLEAYRKK
ncbi:MAG: dihydropteroate synthase [Candidatus Omnitrophica bacterium]|nr:dihydropteroate synthase [Candidatus Omnitrophota bacterium]MBU4303379.1 dihydropteroate synthase [Candidatus Omnitrophota bacterium]MBU4418451.1 dihydropteroate synthase [Candidatus Omnitrophota bacterium]MBU4468765.1 dihydropteroate synthase [Candidatus Omnitrophota bacterium]MCG2708052.1 dihydropteroate synthase [Candidatus Omnitrophota bacterium]